MDRQNTEANCREKSSLVLQSEVKLNWGRELYISEYHKEGRQGWGWYRLGGYKLYSARNDEGDRLCPLCEKREDWMHILAKCTVTEYLRVSYFNSEFLNSRRDVITCLGLVADTGQGMKLGRFLEKVRHLRRGALVEMGEG